MPFKVIFKGIIQILPIRIFLIVADQHDLELGIGTGSMSGARFAANFVFSRQLFHEWVGDAVNLFKSENLIKFYAIFEKFICYFSFLAFSFKTWLMLNLAIFGSSSY